MSPDVCVFLLLTSRIASNIFQNDIIQQAIYCVVGIIESSTKTNALKFEHLKWKSANIELVL